MNCDIAAFGRSPETEENIDVVVIGFRDFSAWKCCVGFNTPSRAKPYIDKCLSALIEACNHSLSMQRKGRPHQCRHFAHISQTTTYSFLIFF